MAGQSSKPTFFWQGVLILLPVLLLALGSIASLRWDEKSAERDARQKAAQNVQSLAQVIQFTVNDELARFIALQNAWTGELFFKSLPNLPLTSDPRLRADVLKWEQDYPGFKLANLATLPAKILQDGRLINPPDTPFAPLPPKWYRDLAPEKKKLWQSLREKLAGNQDTRSARDAFVAGGSAAALQAASNLGLLKSGHFNDGAFGDDAEYSESGISFRGIALGRALRDPSIPLSDLLQRPFWHEIIETPSFIAPMLLEMAQARTNGAEPVISQKLRCTRRLWEIQSEEREWLEPLRHAPELNEKSQPPESWSHWTSGSTGEVLAFGAPLSGNGQSICFVPGEVVRAIFDKALIKNKFLVPDFAQVSLTVEGNALLTPPSNAGANDYLLGTATGNFGPSTMRYPLAAPAPHGGLFDTATFTAIAAKFEIKLLLTSRAEMLSAERRRARLFGLLILGAVAAALVGFVSARRAFRTQLQLSDAKSNFVSSVSHELRAPIASVRLMAESLERGKVQESQRQNQYFQFIVQECRRLSSLIENVLDFSRIEQGRKQYEFEPTDLAALVHETVKLMEPYAAEKGVTLQTHSTSESAQSGSAGVLPANPSSEADSQKMESENEANPDARKSYIVNRKSPDPRPSTLELELDSRAIQQALVNLIDNAVKHSPKGSLVKVEFEWNEDCVRLWVEDEGPGIPPGEHEKIFERFYRLGSELRRETQGVGIGLSIVKHIVEAHGGHVTVRSNLGHGSRFTIELPATSKPQINSNERR